MKLTRAFYARPSAVVARDMIGKVLVRRLEDDTLRGRIVETEAYTGVGDPGSHAYRGRTRRNAVMFGPPGHLYVYISYGMHYCVNVVTECEGVAGAVLLRALEPLEGLAVMEEMRGHKPRRELCNGPGKLCQALQIGPEHYGADLESSDVWLESDGAAAPQIGVSGRVGLSAGADLPLRFYAVQNPYVSPGKPTTRW